MKSGKCGNTFLISNGFNANTNLNLRRTLKLSKLEKGKSGPLPAVQTTNQTTAHHETICISVVRSVFQTFATGTYSQATDLNLLTCGNQGGEVLKEIENQSEFYFLFNQKLCGRQPDSPD
ncbi:MAG: hypothetical protein R2751_11445 [Bacteroidales bacterium]